MDDQADLMRTDPWDHLTAEIVREIVVGSVDAVVTTDDKSHGCHLVEWTSLPFVCEERGVGCQRNVLQSSFKKQILAHKKQQ